MKRSVALLALLAACDCGREPVRERIATCSAAHGEVRFHPQEEWVWNPVRVGDALAAGDWVRTGAEARAQIRFEKSGAEIEVDPGSTVIVQQPEPSEAQEEPTPLISRIKVEAGVVRGEVSVGEVALDTPEGKTIRLLPKAPGQEFEYRVTNRGGVLELAVTEGSARVSGADGEILALGEGQAHDLFGGALVGETIELPRFPELISPGVDASVVLRPKLSIELIWSSVPAAAGYRLQVATDQSFNDLVFDGPIEATRGSFAPSAAGWYAWRVAARSRDGREGEFGFMRRIEVTETTQDLLIAPPHDQLIKVTKPRALVEFSWQAVVPAAPYRLVVARDPRLARKVFERKTNDQKVATRAIGAGTWYWGVYAEGERERALFANPRRLKIRRDVGLRTPDKVTFE